jgi:hypothetical protein
MLRAQAFEGLFTLVPILLIAVLSIFLRSRASRRRKQREEADLGAQARGAAAQGTSTGGAPAGGTPTGATLARRSPGGGALARDAERARPGVSTRTAGSGPSIRGVKLPWERETSEVYPKRSTRPAAAAPFGPQQPPRPQGASRESYIFPPPLPLNDNRLPDTDRIPPRGSRAAAIPRPAARPSVQDGTGLDRMASATVAQDLEQRLEAMAGMAGIGTARPSVEVKAERVSSVTSRLERLPPLKRAVVWAEILGPPGGRQ